MDFFGIDDYHVAGFQKVFALLNLKANLSVQNVKRLDVVVPVEGRIKVHVVNHLKAD